MDNFNVNNFNIGGSNPLPSDDDKPIPFDDEPIPFDDEEPAKPEISREPLHLKTANSQPAATPKQPAATQKPPASPGTQPPKPAVQKPAQAIVSSPDRITGVRTFYTRLHEGAMTFLDQQINSWLKKNPGIVIKQTNTAIGDIVGKRTEPSIVVTIWY